MSIEIRIAEYEAHAIAGKDLYNQLRAQASLDVESGALTLEQAIEREKRLEAVKIDLCIGDWKTALVEVSNQLPNFAVSQEYLDSVKLQIQTYITNNYSW